MWSWTYPRFRASINITSPDRVYVENHSYAMQNVFQYDRENEDWTLLDARLTNEDSGDDDGG